MPDIRMARAHQDRLLRDAGYPNHRRDAGTTRVKWDREKLVFKLGGALAAVMILALALGNWIQTAMRPREVPPRRTG